MTSTVLVTGAAGFIGSHVVDALVARGDIVIGLDNLNDYYDPARKRGNVAESETLATKAPGTYRFIEGDIRDREMLARLWATYGIEAVAHLAGMAGVRPSVDDPHLYVDINLTGTLNLLEQARGSSLRNFVFASTSSVYANTTTIPFVETDPCDRPLAPYAATKRAAELMGHTYHHLHGLNFTAVRLFTVYGPRGRPDMMAHKLLDNVFFGRTVPLYDRGQMHRDWTYVGDTAAGIIAAIDRPLGFEVINLGCAEPVLVADFVAKIEAATGRTTNLVAAPMQDADVAYTNADITKARRLLDYAPRVNVDEGIAALWGWYRSAVLEPGLA